MLKFDSYSATQDFVRNAALDRDRHLVQLLTTMTERTNQLETRLDHAILLLTELKAKDGDQLQSFDERVLEVLEVRSGSARAALMLEDTDVQRWMMSAIEENSGEAFGHIEAEIEEKLEGFLESNSFNEAISDAVRTVSGLSSTIEEVLDGLLHDAIIDAIGDPEDIVRKGLRSIL
jgi:hypothetical protein